MSWKEFDENCPGCRPCILDAKTLKPLALDSDIMRAVNAVWETATREEKQAFHNVCCNNSRADKDMAAMQGLASKIQAACQRN